MTMPLKHKNTLPKALSKQSYTNTLKTTRTYHATTNKALSRLIHARGMDSLHENISLGLAKPSSILFASITCLFGEIISVGMAEMFGYNFNHLLYIYFFLFGYVISQLYLMITTRFRK